MELPNVVCDCGTMIDDTLTVILPGVATLPLTTILELFVPICVTLLLLCIIKYTLFFILTEQFQTGSLRVECDHATNEDAPLGMRAEVQLDTRKKGAGTKTHITRQPAMYTT